MTADRADRVDAVPEPLDTSLSGHRFAFDPFQREAIQHLTHGRSVVVAAPTGAGKTVVADHAIATALRDGQKAFYTTPIKALSNQKYRDYVAAHGADRVGLLTGDVSINGDAPIVVMTTEVLRNMLYSASPTLRGLSYVVLDEVHYLQDPYRGPVWEEVIVHTPPDVRFVCLSATVSNADELTDWISTVRGPTELVMHHERPVELTNLFLAADREGRRMQLIDTLVDGRPNPEGHRFTERPRKRERGRERQRRRFAAPRRAEVVDVLAKRDLLPAIVFVFSRAGCDDAAAQLADAHVMLTEDHERRRIQEIADHHARHLDSAEREVLRYDRFLRNLERGIAAHHAGMVPAFKETVESCFVEGLVKLVFATETLALGINMPARAVVIEKLTKYNGETHEFLTPLQYTQLTGRAGRRGIDDRGHAVVLWSPYVRFEQAAELAASKAFDLTSVFRPTYNMAANLVRGHDRDAAHDLLDRSFAQYQADRGQGRLLRRQNRVLGEIAAIEAKMADTGLDPSKIATAPVPPPPGEASDAIARALSSLKPGEVIASPLPDRPEAAVVLSVGYRSGGAIKLSLVARSHKRLTLGLDDFTSPPEVIGTVELPTPYQPNNGGFQHEVVRRLGRTRLRKRRNRGKGTSTGGGSPDAGHAVPSYDNQQRQAIRQLVEKRAQLARIEASMEGKTGRLSRQFDDIVGILQHRGYIADWSLTDDGERLRRLYHETDLAMAEALRHGLFDDLRAAELAGLVSCFTYESRRADAGPPPRLRSAALRDRFSRVEGLVADIREDETTAGLRLTRELDSGFASIAASWAGGEDLGEVLDLEDLTGGDFVRQVRQLVDVLRQLAQVAPERATRRTAGEAADAIHRGVVVATTVPSPTEDAGGGEETPAAST